MLSAGMLAPLALSTAVRRRGLLSGSPPPMRAAIVISRISLVKSFPRLASSAPFLCLMECHLECPDIRPIPPRMRRSVYHLGWDGGPGQRTDHPLTVQKERASEGIARRGSSTDEGKNPGNVLLSHQVSLAVP